MSFQRERLAEQLIAIDAEIEDIKEALSDPQSARQAEQATGALAIARADRRSTVEQLESLGLEDPDL